MRKTVDYYLSKGFDEKTAKYFSEGRRTIVGVMPTDDFSLVIDFDNGEKRIYDVTFLIQPKTVFERLGEIENFKRVYIDDNNCIAWDIDPDVDSNVVWNNKIDLSPDVCYIDSLPIK